MVLALALLLAEHRVAVLVTGADAAGAGLLQHQIEQRLSALPGVTVVPLPGVTATRPETPVRNDGLDEAIAAYFDGRHPAALDQLGTLLAHHERSPRTPLAERIACRLWRIAVFQALGDLAAAEQEAAAALALDRTLEVDLHVFSPPVADAIAAARAKGIRTAAVSVGSLPDGATLLVDGRAVAHRFEVAVGPHWIVASAPGRREVARRHVVEADLLLAMPLPLSPSADLVSAAAALLAGDGSPPRAAILSLLERLDLRGLVVADEKTLALVDRSVGRSATPRSLRSLVDRRGRVVTAARKAGDAESAIAWAAAAVERLRAPAPRGARDPAFALHGGLSLVRRSRRFGGLESAFTGFGPRLSARAERDALFAGAEASFVSYDASHVTVRHWDGDSRVAGGSIAEGRIALGARVLGAHDRPRVTAELGAAFEEHRARDARDETGPLLLFPSHSRTALDARLAASIPLRAGSLPLRLVGAAGIAPLVWHTERPRGASGARARAAPVPGWRLGIDAAPSAKWQASLEYAGEARRLRWSGTAAARLSPAIEDATAEEVFHSLRASVRWGGR